MFYGNAEFMDVPWETIVKIYRSRLATKRFNTLDEYVAHFLKFLEGETVLFSSEQQRRHLEVRLFGLLTAIQEDVNKRIEDAFKSSKSVTPELIQLTVRNVLKEYYRHFRALKPLPQFDRAYGKKLVSDFAELVAQNTQQILQKLPRSRMDEARIQGIARALITRDDFNGPVSGVVIAGFGEQEHFPKLRSFLVEGIICGVLKYRDDRRADIYVQNTAQISPFAQVDMVSEFMEGVHPTFAQFFQARLTTLFRGLPAEMLKCLGPFDPPRESACRKSLEEFFAKLLNDLNEDQERIRRENHIDPVINTVAVLPKNELATMAEALINLTQFRQKITLQTETVGGPIDVAVISKGDGFVWINRKHYFDPKYNPYFFSNYFREPLEGSRP